MLTLTLTFTDGSVETRNLKGPRVRLGRGPDNDWVLPDPNRRLSRQHCVIEYAEGAFLITDTSANGVFLNGTDKPIGRDQTMRAASGDEVSLGGLRLKFAIADEVAAADETAFLAADATAFVPPPPASAGFVSVSAAPADHAPPGSAEAGLATVITAPLPTTTVPPRPLPMPSAVAADAPPPVTQETAGAETAAVERLIAAFAAGAGLSPAALPDSDPEVLLRRAGEVVRAAVGGLTRTLQARADVKAELYLDNTVLRPANNNPLKFVADETEALKMLLGPDMPAFMPGPKAMADGLKDIESHTHALMEGLRQALGQLVQEFEPGHLKTRLAKSSVIEKALPALLRARYWELYEQTYSKIAADIEAGFHTNYWNAYAKAYDEHCRRKG